MSSNNASLLTWDLISLVLHYLAALFLKREDSYRLIFVKVLKCLKSIYIVYKIKVNWRIESVKPLLRILK